MPRRRSRGAASVAPSHLHRDVEWSGLHEGDPVDVHDPRARGGTWRFAAFVTNAQSGECWVEVVGGRAGDERRRSFRPDQLYPHRSLRAGEPTTSSLLDAPRLL